MLLSIYSFHEIIIHTRLARYAGRTIVGNERVHMHHSALCNR